jgi:hypothetical protein
MKTLTSSALVPPTCIWAARSLRGLVRQLGESASSRPTRHKGFCTMLTVCLLPVYGTQWSYVAETSGLTSDGQDDRFDCGTEN